MTDESQQIGKDCLDDIHLMLYADDKGKFDDIYVHDYVHGVYTHAIYAMLMPSVFNEWT